MGDLTPISGAQALPAMIDRAAKALTDARTHGEVLEAQHIAGAAYDEAKRLGRIARAKDAHDNLIAQVYRAQAGALAIEARAKARLADEYDAAQERGEVAGHGGNTGLASSSTGTMLRHPTLAFPASIYTMRATFVTVKPQIPAYLSALPLAWLMQGLSRLRPA
jgi:hypothetical protein